MDWETREGRGGSGIDTTGNLPKVMRYIPLQN